MSRTLVICLPCWRRPPRCPAEVYKCTVNGSITFSDIPCTGDSEPVRMNIFTPPRRSSGRTSEPGYRREPGQRSEAAPA